MNGDPLAELGGLSSAQMTSPSAGGGGSPFARLLGGGMKGIGQGVMTPGFRRAYQLGAGGVQGELDKQQQTDAELDEQRVNDLNNRAAKLRAGVGLPMRTSGTTPMGGMPSTSPPPAQGGY